MTTITTVAPAAKTTAQPIVKSIEDVGLLLQGIEAAATEKFSDLGARMTDAEQKLARKGGPGGSFSSDADPSDQTKQLEALIEGSEGIKAMRNGHRGRVTLELPAHFFERKNSIVSTGISMPEQQVGIVAPAVRRMTVRALLSTLPTGAGSIQYLQEISFDNAAAAVAEGELKPEASLLFQLKTANVATLAFWLKASNQVLSDTPALLDYISKRLTYGLAFAEELQFLNGAGIDPGLAGIMPAATAYIPPGVLPTGYGPLDVLRLAIAQLAAGEHQASGIILNPADWAVIELLKDSNQRYLTGQPRGMNPASLWGLPVVATTAMAAGAFLVGDFANGALVFDRMQPRVEIGNDGDDFTRNLCTVRGEERAGLALLRPSAMVKGTFA